MSDLAQRIRAALGDRYQIGDELGHGANAVVYRARDLRHDREVAIKVLSPELTATLAAERFLREIASTARVSHPHLVPLLDSGSTGGLVYFVTPFLPGDSARSRLRREGKLPIADVVRIVADVADGLTAAHQVGLVHRDIKPENILFSGRHAVIADFGVAKATTASLMPGLTTGIALGTPTYMAPEQAAADPGVDHRADLYALGVLGYELLAGRPPFQGPTPQATMTAHLMQAPEPIESLRPDVPPVLAQIVMRCLAKRPEDRFASATEIVAMLDSVMTPGASTPASLPPRSRRRLAGAMVAAVVVMVLVVFATLSWRRRQPGGAAVSKPVAQQMATFAGDVDEAALSPDGTVFALVQHQGAERRLVVVARQGSNPVELDRGPRIEEVAWSSDGRLVYYRKLEPDIKYLVVPMLGGPARVVADRRAVLSPDGSTVAILPYTSRRLELVRVETGDTTIVELPADRVKAWALQLAWAPGSDRVAVLTTPTERIGATFAIARREGGAPQLVTVDSVAVHGFCWAAAGDTLMLLVQRGAAAALEALPLEPAGSPARLVTIASGLAGTAVSSDRATKLSTSRDGRVFAYAKESISANVVVGSVVKGRIIEERQLTRGTANHEQARLAPDGRTVAFLRREIGLGVTVGTVPFDGGPSRDLLRLDDATGLAWSPDGRTLAVIGTRAPNPPAAVLIDRDGLTRRIDLNQPVGGQVAWLDSLTLLVQGDQNRAFLAVSVGGQVDSTPALEGGPGWVFDVHPGPAGSLAFYWNQGATRRGLWIREAGREPRQIADGSAVLLGWSADGSEVVATTRPGEADVQLVAYRVADGRSRVLATTLEQLVVDDVMRDLRRVVGHRVDRRGDVWLIERQ